MFRGQYVGWPIKQIIGKAENGSGAAFIFTYKIIIILSVLQASDLCEAEKQFSDAIRGVILR